MQQSRDPFEGAVVSYDKELADARQHASDRVKSIETQLASLASQHGELLKQRNEIRTDRQHRYRSHSLVTAYGRREESMTEKYVNLRMAGRINYWYAITPIVATQVSAAMVEGATVARIEIEAICEEGFKKFQRMQVLISLSHVVSMEWEA
jgi:hypothetical protein